MSKERLLFTLFSIVTLASLGVFVWLVVLFGGTIRQVMNLRSAVASFEEGATAFLALDFEGARNHFQRAHDVIVPFDEHLSRPSFSILEKAPTTHRIISVGRRGARIGTELSEGLVEVVVWGKGVIPIEEEIATLHTVPHETRLTVLRTLSESPSHLEKVRRNVRAAQILLAEIPSDAAFGLLEREEFRSLTDDATRIAETLDQTVRIASVLPLLVGYPRPVEYLVLLQNNTELRPTGGFIGTIGGVRFEAGELTNFSTEGVYNLDRSSEGKILIPAPRPFQQYLATSHLFLRDANWSPDFPTAAAYLHDLYVRERKNAPHLVNLPSEPDYVLAFTPTLIERLLEITGPIRVDGKTFSAETVTNTLEFEVEIGYLSEGTPVDERKAIVGSLGEVLVNRLTALPISSWPEVVSVFRDAIAERHLIVWARDPLIQGDIERNGWEGSVAHPDGDYLMVVDSNLASLKTDPAVARTIKWQTQPHGDGFRTTVTVHYDHTGQFDWKTTRYRSFTRLYVPEGAQLVTARGALQGDRPKIPGAVEVSTELGKTVFGAFISIEPGEVYDLSVSYDLPKPLVDRITQRSYTAMIQKQSGTIAHDYEIDWDFGKDFQPFRSRGDLKTDIILSSHAIFHQKNRY